MFTPVCGHSVLTRCVIRKAWQGSREECLCASAWLNRSGFHAWAWEEIAQLGAMRGAEDGAEEVGEPASTEPSEVMERRDLPRGLGGIKHQWTESRIPPLQSQDGLQSCFCFALNVTGRYLTVPRGSGWIFLHRGAHWGTVCISCLFTLPWAQKADDHSLLQLCL